MKRLIVLLLLALSPALHAQDAAASDPKERIEKRLRLADALEAQGDKEGALQILKELSEKEEQTSDLDKQITKLLLELGRFKEAIPYLLRTLEAQGGKEADHVALARLMLDAQEYKEATTLLEAAAKRFPESPDFPFLLTFALASQERWKEAIAQFEKTLELATDASSHLTNEYFHFRHAAAHERAGNFDEAAALFRQTLGLIRANGPGDVSPEFTATVLNYLAYMWIDRRENLEEAGEMAKEAAALDPVSGAIADTVGWWYFQTGNFPRALVKLKEAERLIESPDPVIYDHIGQTLAKLKEREVAADYFRKALELDPKNADLKARLAEMEPE